MKRVAVVVAVLVVTALVGCDAFLGWRLHHAHAAVNDRTALLARVNVVMPELLSYSGTTITTDTAKAAADTTGDFKTEFTTAMRTVVAPTATRTGVVTKASVSAAGVTTLNANTATVLVFLNQTTTSKTRPLPAVTGSRLSVTLEKVNGQWLVSGVKPL